MYVTTLTVASVLLCYAAIWTTRRLLLIDLPDARKQHGYPVPLAGGLAIFGVILLGSQFGNAWPFSDVTLGLFVLVFALGLIDDKLHLDPRLRLGLHYAAGAAIAGIGGVAIHNVGNLLAMGDIPLLYLSIPLTALSFAGLANAYNMVDGIDGLAGCLIATPLTILLWLGLQQESALVPLLETTLVATVVYLFFNLGPNRGWLPKIFLGDTGSVTLGFLVCAVLIYASQNESLIRPVTALWLVTVPLMDMLATMMRRVMHRQNPLQADRRHVHHALIDIGLPERVVLLLLLAYALACALLGLALEGIEPYLSLWAYILLFLVHCRFAVWLDRRGGDASVGSD